MPSRMVHYEAIWNSGKLAKCSIEARREYTWIYGLADCNGSFEITDLRSLCSATGLHLGDRPEHCNLTKAARQPAPTRACDTLIVKSATSD